jgi:hypothetical protein
LELTFSENGRQLIETEGVNGGVLNVSENYCTAKLHNYSKEERTKRGVSCSADVKNMNGSFKVTRRTSKEENQENHAE